MRCKACDIPIEPSSPFEDLCHECWTVAMDLISVDISSDDEPIRPEIVDDYFDD